MAPYIIIVVGYLVSHIHGQISFDKNMDHISVMRCMCLSTRTPLLSSSLSLRIECRAVIALVHLSTTNFYSLSFLPSSVLLSGERTAAATPYIIQSDSRPVGCRRAAVLPTAGEKDATEHYCQFPSFLKSCPRDGAPLAPSPLGEKRALSAAAGGPDVDADGADDGWMCV